MKGVEVSCRTRTLDISSSIECLEISIIKAEGLCEWSEALKKIGEHAPHSPHYLSNP